MKKRIVTALLALGMTASAGLSVPAYAEETELPALTSTEEYEDLTEASGENTEEPEEPDVDISKYLTITDDKYKELSVTVSEKQEVTDQDVDDEIFQEASDSGLGEQIKEGIVKDGDTVNIDYVGKKDGKEFDGGSADGASLTIGSGTFIDGFEEGLIGKKVGDTVDLDLTFPEDYGAEDLAGQAVVFTVTINYIEGDPELNDDLADKLSDGEYKTLEELRKSVREDLEQKSQEEYERELYSAIFGQLVTTYQIEEYPQDFIDYYVEVSMSQLKQQAEAESESLDDMLGAVYGTDTDSMKDYFKTYAESILQQRIILGAIAKKENITLSDDEFQSIVQGYADQYGISAEELLSYYNEEDIRESELENKVMEYLATVVKVTETDETEYDSLPELIVDTEAETESEGTSSGLAADGETES